MPKYKDRGYCKDHLKAALQLSFKFPPALKLLVFSFSLLLLLSSPLPLPFSLHIQILLFCTLDTLSGMLLSTEHSSPNSAKLFQHMFYFKYFTDQPRATVYTGLIHTLSALLGWH